MQTLSNEKRISFHEKEVKNPILVGHHVEEYPKIMILFEEY